MALIITYDPQAIANYFLFRAKEEDRTIDPMGIQKLVYFAHGWRLALYGRPLINEPIEAWDYGPVIRNLYGEFRVFGNGAITRPATKWRRDQDGNIWQTAPTVWPQDSETISLLSRVWDVYKGFTSIQLSNMTHVAGSPWDTARRNGASIIPDGAIREYFQAQRHGTGTR